MAGRWGWGRLSGDVQASEPTPALDPAISDYFPVRGSYQPDNWFQLGDAARYDEQPVIAAVWACQQIIAKAVAPVRLVAERQASGVWEEVPNSSRTRMLANPNPYQSGMDFLGYQMHALLSDGNSYAWAERDVQGAVTALHPIDPANVTIYRTRETGDILYRCPLSVHEHLQRAEVIPARDVWHMRARTTADPLCGVSPLVATKYVEIIQAEMQKTTAEFFVNKARPGGILKTAQPLKQSQADVYTAAWERAARSGFKGRTALLDRGLEYQDLTVSASDSAIVDQYRLTVEEIARAYGVPGWKVGIGDPSYSNAETMDRAFNAETLRFYFDLIESSLGKFLRVGAVRLNFQVEERIAKTSAAEQVDALTKAIQGGLMTPNEARQRMNLPKQPDADELMVQQQMVPISMAVDPPAPAPMPVPAGPVAVPDDDAEAVG